MINFYVFLLFCYGGLMLTLGVLSSSESKNKHAILWGGISAAIVVATGTFLAFTHLVIFFNIAIATSALLTIAFGVRFGKTKKFYPIGVLAFASLLMTIAGIVALNSMSGYPH